MGILDLFHTRASVQLESDKQSLASSSTVAPSYHTIAIDQELPPPPPLQPFVFEGKPFNETLHFPLPKYAQRSAADYVNTYGRSVKSTDKQAQVAVSIPWVSYARAQNTTYQILLNFRLHLECKPDEISKLMIEATLEPFTEEGQTVGSQQPWHLNAILLPGDPIRFDLETKCQGDYLIFPLWTTRSFSETPTLVAAGRYTQKATWTVSTPGGILSSCASILGGMPMVIESSSAQFHWCTLLLRIGVAPGKYDTRKELSKHNSTDAAFLDKIVWKDVSRAIVFDGHGTNCM